jgi:hypothetical protein
MSAYIKWSERSNQWPNATSQTPRKIRTSKSQNKQERNNKNKSWNQWNRNKQTSKKHTKNHETKCWLFEKINKIDRPLANLTKMRSKNPNQ